MLGGSAERMEKNSSSSEKMLLDSDMEELSSGCSWMLGLEILPPSLAFYLTSFMRLDWVCPNLLVMKSWKDCLTP